MAAGFALVVVVGALTYPSPTWTGDAATFADRLEHPLAWSLGEVFSLLIIPGWVGLAAAVHLTSPAEKKPFTAFALVLTAAYVAIVSANDLVQITTVRLNLEAGTTDGLELWIKDNPQALFFPLEALGYAWQSAAALLVGLVAGGDRLGRAIRWLFTAVAASGLLGLTAAWQGWSFTHPVMILGNAMWTVAFTTGAVLCAIAFRRRGALQR